MFTIEIICNDLYIQILKMYFYNYCAVRYIKMLVILNYFFQKNVSNNNKIPIIHYTFNVI